MFLVIFSVPAYSQMLVGKTFVGRSGKMGKGKFANLAKRPFAAEGSCLLSCLSFIEA
jgi:hypothetical protein